MNFNHTIKKFSLLLLLMFFVLGVSAQQKQTTPNGNKNDKGKNAKESTPKAKQLPLLTVGFGVLSFKGDLGQGTNITSFSGIRGGYSLLVEQRVGKAFGVSLNGIYGKLADNERSMTRNLNFQSNIIQADLNLLFHFDNDFILKRNSSLAPYLAVGVGYLMFNSYTDLKDKNGNTYNYWSDGTIRNLPEGATNATVLQRDYTYETKLNDSAKYANSTISIPLTFGVDLKLADRVAVNLAVSYYMTMTDWIDNVKAGGNDSYVYAKFGLKFNFGKTPEESGNTTYETIDFSSLDKLDSDGDGVKDANDVCPGTPKNVKVNSEGCPEDNDKDGVPDYKDKEPLTKQGAVVDENGVTLTEQMIAERQKAYNAQAVERSNMFNENPSLGYLKDVESKIRQNGANRNTGSVPASLRSADLNGDGLISTEEISKAIDSFFEGDSDFTVEKLNDLIDYFFEQ